ncbi:MAG: 16S rRNA (cytidine(1402)-2'-O)-methyltransferase [Candidatus Eremiobacteraeota bacterium]|nr:16S rRNA (cytidine(1402)-2'-O)-methyltransferase [Candidatus Eremiobacteraeota bacterium]
MPLVLVPTPLGNLGDITLRALETLRSADLVVAEDTRVTRKLLNALGVGSKELWSYREQNADGATPGILQRAASQLVAVVTDAGMPGISDPGEDLVAAARAASIAVEVLPGPSAVLGAAVLSGFPLRRFAFEGFPPRGSSARKAAFTHALRIGATTVWYESPQRILHSLDDLAAVAPDAQVFLVREYTKKFEQQVLGLPREVAAALEEPVRGEITFVIAPRDVAAEQHEMRIDDETIDALLDQGESVRDIAKQLSEKSGADRRELYERASKRKNARGMGRRNRAEEQRPE